MDGAPDLSSEFDNRQLRTNRRQTTAALAHIGYDLFRLVCIDEPVPVLLFFFFFTAW